MELPWIYELWCAKDQPHPEPPRFSRDDLAKIRQELKARREASQGGSSAALGPT
ncbi:MAG: hypothetical protein WKF43_10665 [Acidimicrobiales bacterium]